MYFYFLFIVIVLLIAFTPILTFKNGLKNWNNNFTKKHTKHSFHLVNPVYSQWRWF